MYGLVEACLGRRERSLGLVEFRFSKFEVEGPKAEAFLDEVLACRLPQKTGRTVLAPMLNRKGGIIGAVISFLITAAVVFFVIIKPMNKLMSMMKKEEEAAPPPAPAADIVLLTEIRDLLKK